MAILHCRHCEAAIDSDARRSQCRECLALFPFECAVCGSNLRAPFPVFDDERHLTMDEVPQPLCEDHFFRKCPECQQWFQNHQNPGYFRCRTCAEKIYNTCSSPGWTDELLEAGVPFEAGTLPTWRRALRPASPTRGGLPLNALALGAAGCAFLLLIGWFWLGY